MVSNRDSESRVDFRVKKAALTEHELVKSPAPTGSLGPGQVVLEVDRFAFTANNISYAVAGDMLDYWGFFPAEDGWGRIPAMAYADVIASTCDAVALGERFFGLAPRLLGSLGATHGLLRSRSLFTTLDSMSLDDVCVLLLQLFKFARLLRGLELQLF